MDPNLKDILLVLLGAAGSLLGTALTLFFELRRDKFVARRERKIKDYEQLIDYLTRFSRLNSALITYWGHMSISGPEFGKHYFESTVNTCMQKLAESPLSGLPPMLMTRDKTIAHKLEPLSEYNLELTAIFSAIAQGMRTAELVYVQQQSQKNSQLNKFIDQIFTDIEKRLY